MTLVALAPLAYYVVNALQPRMTEPTSTLDRWLVLTLLVNLVYDVVHARPQIQHPRFFPEDIRMQFQWSPFLCLKFDFVDTFRYVMMASGACYLRKTAEVTVIVLVMAFYGVLTKATG